MFKIKFARIILLLQMKIITLIENTKPENIELNERFGLCLYIESNGKKILFDTGPDDAFLTNASILGINLSQIDACVLSHAHFDHSGGLRDFFKVNESASVYALGVVSKKYYTKKISGNYKNISIDDDTLMRYSKRFHFFEEQLSLFGFINLYVVRDYKTFIPASNCFLYQETDNKPVLDNFEHELVMSVTENGQNTIFTGCGHNGVLNMVQTVKNKMPDIPINALIGGFHLVNPTTKMLNENESIVISLAKSLLDADIKHIYTGHCTGNKGFELLKDVLNSKLDKLCTGKEIEI